MTLEEAIKILSDPNHITFLRTIDKHAQAIQLGIEALKAIQRHRIKWYSQLDALLPGETESLFQDKRC